MRVAVAVGSTSVGSAFAESGVAVTLASGWAVEVGADSEAGGKTVEVWPGVGVSEGVGVALAKGVEVALG